MTSTGEFRHIIARPGAEVTLCGLGLPLFTEPAIDAKSCPECLRRSGEITRYDAAKRGHGRGGR